MLVDLWGDFHGGAGRLDGLDGPGDGRVIEELLVNGLRVLVGEQPADSDLLVYQVGHGELLPHQLRAELRRQQTGTHDRLQARRLASDGRAVVVLAVRRLLAALCQVCQLVDVRQVGWALPEDTVLRQIFPFH